MATLKVTNIKNESFAGDQLYLKTDGKIGIGTASPNHLLHVEGSLSGTTGFNLTNTNASGYGLYVKGGGTGNYAFRVDNQAGNEALRILDGKLLIGTTSAFNTNTKLNVAPTNRTSAFSASDGDTWHDIVLKQTGDNAANAVGIAFEISTSAYHKNAGTGIACVKNGTAGDYGSDLVLITRPQSAVAVERMRIKSTGALGTNSTVRSAYGGLDLCSQGATNLGTLTLGAGGGQNGQSRSANQENQFRIMMPTYADPSNMTTVLYGVSGSAGHELHYGGGTGWAYATNSHKFFTTGNQTTGTGTERLKIDSNGNLTAVNTAAGGQSVTLSVGASNASGTNDGIIKIINGGLGNGVIQWDYETNLNRAQIYVYRSTQELIFTVAGNERARITDDGIKLPADKGINFSAYATSGNPSSNLLSDYEEGSWTPECKIETRAASDSPIDGVDGCYTKVGRVVTCHGKFTLNGTPSERSTSRAIEIHGFPFDHNHDWDKVSGDVRVTGHLLTSTYGDDISFVLRLIPGSQYCRLELIEHTYNGTRNASVVMQDNMYVVFSFTYVTV